RGVKLAEGVRVTAIERAGDRVTGVTTTDGAVSAPLVINAAGPVAATVGRLAGVEILVQPRRRHIFFTEPFPEIPGPIPLTTDRASGFYFRKEMEQVLLSPGDVEDIGADFEVPMDWRRLDEAVDKAVRRVPVLGSAKIAGGWAGLRGRGPDDRRRSRLSCRHPRQAPAPHVVHDAARDELRLCAHRDAGRPRRLGRGGVPRRPDVERGVRGVRAGRARALRRALARRPRRD